LPGTAFGGNRDQHRSTRAGRIALAIAQWAFAVSRGAGQHDPHLNLGHINLGLSRDTSEFACESFLSFWNRFSKKRYPDATSILLTCDGGASNPKGEQLFKCDLQNLDNATKLPLRIAHFPSYCSKYNPTERRFLPHIGRACEGMLLDSLERVIDLMRRAKVRRGLPSTVNVLEKACQIGRVATDSMKKAVKIRYDVKVPKWNHTIRPESATKGLSVSKTVKTRSKNGEHRRAMKSR